jgi:peptidoglycan/LPS O-acetylase OafA/YrhL
LIRPLTSLRFFAALMVIAHHYWNFAAGYAGVTFFYVLSGYILAVNYPALHGWTGYRRFWRNRFARIYPLHLFTLLASLPVAAWGFEEFVANATLSHSLVPSWSFWFSFNAPSWSISNEAIFYAGFPVLLWAARKGWLVAAALAALVLTALIWAWLRPQVTLDDGPTRFLFYIFPPTRMVEFFIGVWLALQNKQLWFGFSAEATALCLFAAGLLSASWLPGSFAASIIFLPGAVALVAVFASSRGPLAGLLSQRVLVELGNASFALYMVHYLVKVYAESFTEWSLEVSVAAAIVAVALSLVLHRALELPLQRVIRRKPNGVQDAETGQSSEGLSRRGR